MKYSWDDRVARAHHLAATKEDAGPLMSVYARLLELQRDELHVVGIVLHEQEAHMVSHGGPPGA